MLRSVIVFALLMAVGGCAGGLGAPSAEASKTIQQARTVGVISAVGHKFSLQKIGITVFGNELNEVASGSWGLDEAIANKVSALLGSRYAVRRIGYSSGDLDAAAPDVIRKIAGSQKHDLYIVVTRSSVPFSSSNQIAVGLGMIEAGGSVNPDNVTLFAVTAVHVYDGRTFEHLGWQRTTNEYGGALGTIINAPHRKLDRSWWPATAQAAHNEKLKAATRALLADSLARTIPEVMGMSGGPKGKKDTWSPFKP